MKARGVIGSLARVMRKKCVHEGKESFKEQYSPANIDIWIRDLTLEYGTALKSVCCGN